MRGIAVVWFTVVKFSTGHMLEYPGTSSALPVSHLGPLPPKIMQHFTAQPTPALTAPARPTHARQISEKDIFKEASEEEQIVQIGHPAVVTAGRRVGWVGLVKNKLPNGMYRVLFEERHRTLTIKPDHLKPFGDSRAVMQTKIRKGDRIRVSWGRRRGQVGIALKVFKNGLVQVKLDGQSKLINFKHGHLEKVVATPAPTSKGTKPAWQRLLEGPTSTPTVAPTQAPTKLPTMPTPAPTAYPTIHVNPLAFNRQQRKFVHSEGDITAALERAVEHADSTCSGKAFEKNMFKTIKKVCKAYHGHAVKCARKCEGLVKIGITNRVPDFRDPNWSTCELGWRKYIQGDFCWPKQCRPTMNYVCGGFRGKLVLKSKHHKQLGEKVTYDMEEMERACSQDNAQCQYYDACDACMAHYIWGKRPIKHWKCWLDEWQGFKSTFTPPVQVGSRVKVAGLIKHKTLNGKFGVATSSLAAKGIDGFSVRLDGLDKEKLFRRVNLIEEGLRVGNLVRLMAGDVDGKHKGATGHVLAADFGGGAYKIQLDVNNRSVTVPSANLAVPPPQNNFCGNVRQQKSHELLVKFDSIRLETAKHYHTRGIGRLSSALLSIGSYMWKHVKGIHSHQIKRWGKHQLRYNFAVPVEWKKIPEGVGRPLIKDYDTLVKYGPQANRADN